MQPGWISTPIPFSHLCIFTGKVCIERKLIFRYFVDVTLPCPRFFTPV
jgi:hypothetical protein